MVEANISVLETVKFIGVILTMVVSSIIVAKAIKRGYQNYIDTKMNVMDIRMANLEKEVSDNKADNQREHDEMKKEFIHRVDQIWNWIKDKA